MTSVLLRVRLDPLDSHAVSAYSGLLLVFQRSGRSLLGHACAEAARQEPGALKGPDTLERLLSEL